MVAGFFFGVTVYRLMPERMQGDIADNIVGLFSLTETIFNPLYDILIIIAFSLLIMGTVAYLISKARGE